MIQRLIFTIVICAAVHSGQKLDKIADEHEMCHYPTNVKCWTPWFENPSGTIDNEAITNLRLNNPGKICPKPAEIEISNIISLGLPGNMDTVDNITSSICKDEPSFCQEYGIHFNRVRFSCHPPFCKDKDEQFFQGRVCWTNWLSRDNPHSSSGDWEDLGSLKNYYSGIICSTPLFIESITRDDRTPATETGQNFFKYSPTEGLVCRNKDQKDKSCRDYAVRFGCPCPAS